MIPSCKASWMFRFIETRAPVALRFHKQIRCFCSLMSNRISVLIDITLFPGIRLQTATLTVIEYKREAMEKENDTDHPLGQQQFTLIPDLSAEICSIRSGVLTFSSSKIIHSNMCYDLHVMYLFLSWLFAMRIYNIHSL